MRDAVVIGAPHETISCVSVAVSSRCAPHQDSGIKLFLSVSVITLLLSHLCSSHVDVFTVIKMTNDEPHGGMNGRKYETAVTKPGFVKAFRDHHSSRSSSPPHHTHTHTHTLGMPGCCSPLLIHVLTVKVNLKVIPRVERSHSSP
jgi:hypothetical protein